MQHATCYVSTQGYVVIVLVAWSVEIYGQSRAHTHTQYLRK